MASGSLYAGLVILASGGFGDFPEVLGGGREVGLVAGSARSSDIAVDRDLVDREEFGSCGYPIRDAADLQILELQVAANF